MLIYVDDNLKTIEALEFLKYLDFISNVSTSYKDGYVYISDNLKDFIPGCYSKDKCTYKEWVKYHKENLPDSLKDKMELLEYLESKLDDSKEVVKEEQNKGDNYIKCVDSKCNIVEISKTKYHDENGFYCRVYAGNDTGHDYEIDNFCVHDCDCNCRDDKEVDTYITGYVTSQDYTKIIEISNEEYEESLEIE